MFRARHLVLRPGVVCGFDKHGTRTLRVVGLTILYSRQQIFNKSDSMKRYHCVCLILSVHRKVIFPLKLIFRIKSKRDHQVLNDDLR